MLVKAQLGSQFSEWIKYSWHQLMTHVGTQLISAELTRTSIPALVFLCSFPQ